MKQLVIGCSLSPQSHSQAMAQELVTELSRIGDEAELVDLRQVALPFCDGGESFGDQQVARLSAKIQAADAIALAVPVYNFDVGGATRNLIAMTGSAWNDKVVGLMGAAGGQRSYMALMGVASSLMLDFRCVIIPRYAYAGKQSFSSGELTDPEVKERIARLAKDLNRFSQALAPVLNGIAS